MNFYTIEERREADYLFERYYNHNFPKEFLKINEIKERIAFLLHKAFIKMVTTFNDTGGKEMIKFGSTHREDYPIEFIVRDTHEEWFEIERLIFIGGEIPSLQR